MRSLILALLFAGIFVSPQAAAQSARSYAVTVDAGSFDRHQAIASFYLPRGLPDGAYRLVDANGRAVPLQVDLEGQGWFIVNHLPAGTAATFRIEPAPAAAGGVRAVYENGAVNLQVGNQQVIRYNFEKTAFPRPDIAPIFARGGYIHPVLTPSGRVVTDDFPPDHVHHHGIWAAWTNTEFEGRTPDFWNMGGGTGTVEAVALDEVWSGPVQGGFRARHQYVDLTAEQPTPAIDEQWEVHVFNVAAPYRVFDLQVTHTTAGSSPLILPEYRYGGVGLRGHEQWLGPGDKAMFLTSEGRTRADGHATRARWAHMGGLIDGHLAGIALMSHPDNFRHPEPMRIHPSEPFFNWAPSQAGDWSIEPGKPFVARYRYVVHDGAPDAADLDRIWNDFAYPPAVSVEVLP